MGARFRGIPSVLFWIPFGLVLVACGSAAAGGEGDMRDLAAGNNAFALDLYDRLRPAGGNLLFSPFGISTALAMTYGGARGATRLEMEKTLRFGPEPDRLHRAFQGLLRELAAVRRQDSVRLETVNALWPHKGVALLPEYLGLLRTHYGAEPIPVDFVNDREGARLLINRWVEERTDRMIEELIRPGVLDAATRLALTNALHLKGDWANRFNPSLTREAPFWLSPGKSIPVHMMSQKAYLGYAEGEDYRVLELPYIGNDLSMIVLLPRQVDGWGELESKMSPPSIRSRLEGLEQREVLVFLPKFTLSGQLDLSDTLSAMGMGTAFGQAADFSGMDGTHTLRLSAFPHKASLEVGEEGAEAAAASAVVARLTSVSTPSPVFRADHPFVFLIRENRTKGILLMGRLTRPGS